jgi:hypothetical protein
MSPMHRRAVAVTLIVAGVALSACAQRGGAMGRSGVASHSAPAFRASPAPSARAGFMAAPQFSANRNSSLSSSQRFVGRPAPAGYSGRRTGTNRNQLDNRYRRSYRPFYGVGLPYGYLGYPGIGFDDDSAYGASQPSPGPQSADYGPPPDPQAAQYGESPAAPPVPAYRPAYQRPQPKYDPAPEDPVTLVFKDGRPTEQIQNYMVTRTTLYVQGRRLREIPVDQLDLAATEKVNLDAGVEFQLPDTSR